MEPPIGPITDEALYVERDADKKALLCLQRGEIVTVIEPRQQGKTSLVYAMRRHPSMQSMSIVYVDVSTLRKNTASDWYHDFCRRILEQLPFLSSTQRPPLPQDSGDFRSFLAELSQLFSQHEKGSIIVLDEVATLRFPGSTEFFAVLRDVFNSRDAEKYFRRITFMLVGVFRPQDLIQDSKVSPFNVAIRVSLDDFNMDELATLVRSYGVQGPLAKSMTDKIHYWTDGQPYLCQILCSKLTSDPLFARLSNQEISIDDALSEQIDQFFRKDDNHIKALISRLSETIKARPGLSIELGKIIKGGAVDYYPAALSWQEDLQLLGIIKEAKNHTCTIRNRIYERALNILIEKQGDEIVQFDQSKSDLKERSKTVLTSVLNLPKPLGRFVFDIFGRQSAADSSAIIMGWVLALLFLLILRGFIQLEAVVSFFKSIWDFFHPAG